VDTRAWLLLAPNVATATTIQRQIAVALPRQVEAVFEFCGFSGKK
jgi:hypothetical protein